MEKSVYIAAINAELKKGGITLRNRVRRMGKGLPVEQWDEAQLARLCNVAHISLLSPEEEAAMKAHEAEVMAKSGIRHATTHAPYLTKLEGEDVAAMAGIATGYNESPRNGDYWDYWDSVDTSKGAE